MCVNNYFWNRMCKVILSNRHCLNDIIYPYCIFRVGKFPRYAAASSPTVRTCGKPTHSKVGVHYIFLQSFCLRDVFMESELWRQAMCVERNIEARSCSYCSSGKAMSLTYYECMFVDLFVQQAMRMHPVVICGLWGSKYFCTLSHKPHDLRGGKKPLNIKFIFWFSLQLLSEIFLILGRIRRGMFINMYTGLHVKFPLFLSDFNEACTFSTEFRKILKCQI